MVSYQLDKVMDVSMLINIETPINLSNLYETIREVTLTTAEATTKSMGGSQNYGYVLWADHTILGTFYGGITKSILGMV